jgi:hypothetical protein
MNSDVRVMTPNGRQAIHWSELPELDPCGSLSTEWNTYRREVGRLLDEGHEGEWVVIKGEEVVGVWQVQEEALTAAAERFLLELVLVHQISTLEPTIRTPNFFWRCRS